MVVTVPSQSGPLAGVRVLEMGSLIAGPFAARVLADFGAEVIKIEPPKGDPIRKWGRLSPTGDSWWWYVQSRNKKHIVVDVHYPAGQELVRRMAEKVDVLIENFRPGQMEKWGLGYEQMKAVNPGLIYVSVSGFGQTGPYRTRAGFGNIAESMSGMRYVTGFPDRPPVRVGFSIGDEIAALYAVIGALLSLFQRERADRQADGASETPGGQAFERGEHVDVALTEAVFSLTESTLTEYAHLGVIQERRGNQLLRTAPSNIYPTRDGRWLAIGANTDAVFPRLAAAMGRPELAADARFQDNPGRVAHADELDAVISDWTSQHTLDDLMACLNVHAVPAGPVMNVADIAADVQYQARGMIAKVPSDDLGEVVMPGIVPKLKHRPGRLRATGGRIGRDTDEVLRRLVGLSDDELKELREKGVIQ